MIGPKIVTGLSIAVIALIIGDAIYNFVFAPYNNQKLWEEWLNREQEIRNKLHVEGFDW